MKNQFMSVDPSRALTLKASVSFFSPSSMAFPCFSLIFPNPSFLICFPSNTPFVLFQTSTCFLSHVPHIYQHFLTNNLSPYFLFLHGLTCIYTCTSLQLLWFPIRKVCSVHFMIHAANSWSHFICLYSQCKRVFLAWTTQNLFDIKFYIKRWWI